MDMEDKIKNAVKFSNILTFNGKNFIEITQQEVPNIAPGKFYISADGVVYNSLTHRFSEGCSGVRDYVVIELTDSEGKRFSIMKHVVLERVFNWFDRCKDLEVNHKNGIRNDNRLENLEMVTHSENMNHAFRTGLNKNRGETHTDATTTEEQARHIIEILMSGDRLKYAEIGELVGVSEMVVVQIATGYGWTWLCNEMGYTPIKRNKRFTDDEVHQMCKIFEEHIGDEFENIVQDVANRLGYNCDSNFAQKLSFIYYRRRSYFTRITALYKYLPEDFINQS